MATGQLRAPARWAVLVADPTAAARHREKAEKEARVEVWSELRRVRVDARHRHPGTAVDELTEGWAATAAGLYRSAFPPLLRPAVWRIDENPLGDR